ncbi:hypothetical protein N1495_07070 [Streptococcus didelphis]|uniref:Uncharacterized protein n=1 Tax=Streptococcus didelphis TaxID=102886 RepID=A0ABY9LI10_9STRE|nr:hypothetical protein [Streptococcus didelphis]WMB28487.1 hypothetical protein N1496_02640 [Streptococcus didelphis]WMB29163.1 hypothetical protein N1495_07070 [Streptococcus didelphis]
MIYTLFLIIFAAVALFIVIDTIRLKKYGQLSSYSLFLVFYQPKGQSS